MDGYFGGVGGGFRGGGFEGEKGEPGDVFNPDLSSTSAWRREERGGDAGA